ncbi:lytic transglycosylase domain-containing protein [Inhella gelatinilytica]|uniref:Lytic transglycosylase domain-containing protein n=1 Tax=Inhella gelatinilytica TaxID=2795030 RepID=A0A931IUA0_9BURK|nr:lytic transglycosylase domain-containing protein [Inhella gelatinilytica]MBH9552264.1 lytic transglycosylase domain-containing protein [Inhella gelatinilytica]
MLKKLLWAALAAFPFQIHAQPADALLDAAREAWRKRDVPALSRLADQAQQAQHPLAPWVDYWRTFSRLPATTVADVEAFYQRWPGSYVEDRLRNDWLLELGRRKDWAAFAADYPRFRMDDDREVHCHALHAEHRLGRPVKDADKRPFKDRALTAWLAQREADEGCQSLAEALVETKVFGTDDIRRKINSTVEAGRTKAFRQTLGLLKKHDEQSLELAYDKPALYLQRKARPKGRWHQEEIAVALVRQAAQSTEGPAEQLENRWAEVLPPALKQWVWSQFGRQAASRLHEDAASYYRKALAVRSQVGDWSDETLSAGARAALRTNSGSGDWDLLRTLVSGMPESLRSDPTWQYWHAQARYRSAPEGERGEPARREARGALLQLASPLHFYGQLAAEDVGANLALPAVPAPLTEAERQAATQHAGLSRALLLIQSGLRSEGVREWNFSLRGLGDRELLAAAQRACDAQVWDRCINTSEKTKHEVHLGQRFPTPFRTQVQERAQAAGLNPADPYGLIRQESRFILDARSGVGASGLMQLMPATAKWTAKKIGLPYQGGQIADMDTNLRLGMAYLRLVLDDFGGALPLAAAAYNAGPSRSRRWREGPEMDAAAWAETIPFTETRDYVKKVLANATLYARLMGQPQALLRERLGQRIGPRPASAPPANGELP